MPLVRRARLPRRVAGRRERLEWGKGNESTGIGKKDLWQMQGDPPARRGAGNLRQSEAQAASGL